MRKYSIVTVLLLLRIAAVAQQDPMYTQYMFNLPLINPGYVGSTDFMSATFLTRHQWVGFDGAPSTQTISFVKPLNYLSSGVGFSAVHDKVGPLRTTGVNVDLAYQLKISPTIKLGMGVKGGLNYYMVDFAELEAPTDQALQTGDNEARPNLGFGLFLSSDLWYVGLSTPQLLRSAKLFGDQAVAAATHKERHYFLNAGYVFMVNKGKLALRPSICLKKVANAPVSVDVSTMVILFDRLWLGAAYRYGDAVTPIMHVIVNKNFKLGYSYDVNLSKLRTHHTGTHEILLTYDVFTGLDKVVSPRYF